jgi:putative ATP-dependent endonuclease of the OLD family
MAAVEQILQPSQNELFFCGCPVIVEGTEDVAFLATYLQLCGKWSAFRRYGCHFVVAEGKNKLSRPLAIALALGIPTFVVFDGDVDRTGNGQPKANERDNGCILRLCGSGADVLSTTTVWEDNLIMWPTRIADVVRDELGAAQWNASEEKAKQRHGLTTDVQRKNGIMVAATVEQLWGDGLRSENLDEVCERILAFAQKHQPLLVP